MVYFPSCPQYGFRLTVRRPTGVDSGERNGETLQRESQAQKRGAGDHVIVIDYDDESNADRQDSDSDGKGDDLNQAVSGSRPRVRQFNDFIWSTRSTAPLNNMVIAIVIGTNIKKHT